MISFGHSAFVKLLLVATSMDDLVDYHKFLLGGYGQVLQSVHTRLVDVLLSSQSQFSSCLWHVERDSDVVRYFMQMLFKTGTLAMDSSLRFLAVHHIISCIWEDLACCLGVNVEWGWHREKATRMFKAVVWSL